MIIDYGVDFVSARGTCCDTEMRAICPLDSLDFLEQRATVQALAVGHSASRLTSALPQYHHHERPLMGITHLHPLRPHSCRTQLLSVSPPDFRVLGLQLRERALDICEPVAPLLPVLQFAMFVYLLLLVPKHNELSWGLIDIMLAAVPFVRLHGKVEETGIIAILAPDVVDGGGMIEVRAAEDGMLGGHFSFTSTMLLSVDTDRTERVNERRSTLHIGTPLFAARLGRSLPTY